MIYSARIGKNVLFAVQPHSIDPAIFFGDRIEYLPQIFRQRLCFGRKGVGKFYRGITVDAKQYTRQHQCQEAKKQVQPSGLAHRLFQLIFDHIPERDFSIVVVGIERLFLFDSGNFSDRESDTILLHVDK